MATFVGIMQNGASTSSAHSAVVMTDSVPDGPPAMKRFKYLASKLQQQSSTTAQRASVGDSVQGQLSRYMADIQSSSSPPVEDALQYWRQQPTCNKKLAAFAEDLISAPASQTYVERIFSLRISVCWSTQCYEKVTVDEDMLKAEQQSVAWHWIYRLIPRCNMFANKCDATSIKDIVVFVKKNYIKTI